MTAVTVRMYDGNDYTLTSAGWTGPDPQFAASLNMGFRPDSTIAANPVLLAAKTAARDLLGDIVNVRIWYENEDEDEGADESEHEGAEHPPA